jgi:uncharacterized protein YndB with AHSA1/START domain
VTGVEGKAALIDRPVEDVWRFMLDISNMPKWEDSGAEWRQTSEGPIDVGTTFQSSIHLLGRNVLVKLRVAVFEPNRRFAVETLDGFWRGSKISYSLEPVEGGKTRLSRMTEVELHGLGKVFRPFQALVVRRTGGIEANNVKRFLEGQTR